MHSERGAHRCVRSEYRQGRSTNEGSAVLHPDPQLLSRGKWGLEGFTESVSREVADFGIHLTLVEPGGTRTGFVSGLHFTTETAAYRDNAVGGTRRYLETADDSVLTGNPAKLAAAIYDTTRAPNPPLRLPLGSDAYDAIHTALTERLTALETQKDLAASVAFNR
ncbi:hypothetical protein [Streptomyces tubercidicus]|uniref:hypothetical protein n=1 Tax=Streptomyces tubercidicus TaxID=47759 RepID=UPI002E12AD67|nr:hypothetical protein OG761_04105 [Streptomyces tubercidicus]